MPIHDYNLADASGLAFRVDANNVLAAIISQNSSPTEPTTVIAYMLWADTTTAILKQRNAGNSGWISLFNMTTGAWLGNAATATTATNQSGGTVAATTGSFSGLISADGGQIKFPATQVPSADANTLDDYEEGTWTPSVGGTATYLIQTGVYTKIGRLVSFQTRLQINVLGTGLTSTISGLPFTAAESVTPCSFLDSNSAMATAVVSVSPYVGGGNIFIQSRTAASTLATTNAIFTNTTTVNAAGSYAV